MTRKRSRDGKSNARQPKSEPFVRLAVPREGVPLVGRISGRSVPAEQYRKLAVQVVERVPKTQETGFVLAVTSPEPAAGKTVTSLNLGITLSAAASGRTILIEADLVRPRFLEYISVHRSVRGLAQAIRDQSFSDAHVAKLRGSSLDLVIATSASDDNSELLLTPGMHRIMEQLRAQYDLILVDCPPLMLASGQALMAIADAALVVVRAGKTRRRAIEDTLTLLEKSRVLGLVLNGVKGLEQSYLSYREYADYLGRSEPSRSKD